MNIEENKEIISGFKHLELLANQVEEGFISGMHKDFLQNLLSIKYIILEKALNILIGNYLPKRIDYIRKDLKKRPIFGVI